MSDDLVKRLRDLVGQHIGDADIDDELLDAADRIEKLEAALNCNLPDYDPKIGIVERLRQLGNWRVDGTKSSPIYNKSADHIEKLEAALREIAEANSVQAGPDKDMYRRWRRVATNAIDIARKALEDKQ